MTRCEWAMNDFCGAVAGDSALNWFGVASAVKEMGQSEITHAFTSARVYSF